MPIKDKTTLRAKREGLRARSAYKLKELNNKYRVLHGAKHALDLGCWPGGWSLVAAKFCPVTAVDLERMFPIDNVTFIQGDLFDDALLEKLPMADVVLSDAAPKTAGDSNDKYRSFLLSSRSLEIATLRLRPNGSFVCKIFQGEDFDEFMAETRKHFTFVKSTKPPTSKPQSKEMYIVATGFQPRQN